MYFPIAIFIVCTSHLTGVKITINNQWNIKINNFIIDTISLFLFKCIKHYINWWKNCKKKQNQTCPLLCMKKTILFEFRRYFLSTFVGICIPTPVWSLLGICYSIWALVDNASPDRTFLICDECASSDSTKSG